MIHWEPFIVQFRTFSGIDKKMLIKSIIVQFTKTRLFLSDFELHINLLAIKTEDIIKIFVLTTFLICFSHIYGVKVRKGVCKHFYKFIVCDPQKITFLCQHDFSNSTELYYFSETYCFTSQLLRVPHVYFDDIFMNGKVNAIIQPDADGAPCRI